MGLRAAGGVLETELDGAGGFWEDPPRSRREGVLPPDGTLGVPSPALSIQGGVPMKRRLLWLALAAVGVAPMLTGCETLHRFGRRPNGSDEAVVKSAMPVEEGEAESKTAAGPKGFFKPTRLPGGLSSEANEIERSLGVQ